MSRFLRKKVAFVTVRLYVGGIRFYKPVRIGHMVEVYARVIYTGTTKYAHCR